MEIGVGAITRIQKDFLEEHVWVRAVEILIVF